MKKLLFLIMLAVASKAHAQIHNYFAGTNAGNGNTGSYNTGVAYDALPNHSSGSYNSAFGYASLYTNTSGGSNTAAGYKALFLNTSGSNNTASGYEALYSNVNGINNTAAGLASLYSNTYGSNNLANGVYALYSNTTGSSNTANGYFALWLNTEGYSNTATGTFALKFNHGSRNTATGDSALFSNDNGFQNTATGVAALYSNTTGIYNTASGAYALGLNSSGSYNTSTGVGSLYNNAGSFNTASGYNAGELQPTYTNCTFVGGYADASKDNLINATAIGYRARVNAKNKVEVGNSNVTSIGGQVGWTSFSDERIKNNIKENVPGLAFINLLRPVTYHFNTARENELLGIQDDKTADNDIQKISFTGLLAQDVDKAAQKINYDFSGVDKTGSVMGLRYSEFVVPLIKGEQELSKQNDSLKSALTNLQSEIDALKTMIVSNQSTASNQQAAVISSASLSQNIPNPFQSSTSISYTLPQASSSAKIIVTDKSGNAIKSINISGSKGSVNIDASTLAAGAYQYSLYVDGRLIASKQMISSK